ncbi:ADH-N domain-containing protein [Fusarium sp. Ph1]|nr:ADH-N domain-containing protein [Fusarium sp. Ph1]
MASAITSQPRTILGPLTTTFTQPSSCRDLVGLCETCHAAFQGQSCGQMGAQDNPSCWPPTSAGAPSPTHPLRGWGIYSPGIVCPSGHTSACTAIAGGNSEWLVQFSMKAGETAVGCCPTGYSCANNYGNTCVVGPTSTVVSTVICEGGTSGSFSQLTIRDTTTSSPYAFFAPMIQINWQPSDIIASSTSWQTKSTSTLPASGTSTANSPSSAGGPSPSLIGGVCAAAIIFIGLIVSVIFILFRRYRSKKSQSMEQLLGMGSRGHSNNPLVCSDVGNSSLTGISDQVPTSQETGHQFNTTDGTQNNSTGSGHQFAGATFNAPVYFKQ